MIQKITQNSGNFWTVNLIMRAKIVNQSSDFPVRRTGSYRHKKSTATNSVKALKLDRVLTIRLQSHQVHHTIMQQLYSMKQQHIDKHRYT